MFQYCLSKYLQIPVPRGIVCASNEHESMTWSDAFSTEQRYENHMAIDPGNMVGVPSLSIETASDSRPSGKGLSISNEHEWTIWWMSYLALIQYQYLRTVIFALFNLRISAIKWGEDYCTKILAFCVQKLSQSCPTHK